MSNDLLLNLAIIYIGVAASIALCFLTLTAPLYTDQTDEQKVLMVRGTLLSPFWPVILVGAVALGLYKLVKYMPEVLRVILSMIKEAWRLLGLKELLTTGVKTLFK